VEHGPIVGCSSSRLNLAPRSQPQRQRRPEHAPTPYEAAGLVSIAHWTQPSFLATSASVGIVLATAAAVGSGLVEGARCALGNRCAVGTMVDLSEEQKKAVVPSWDATSARCPIPKSPPKIDPSPLRRPPTLARFEEVPRDHHYHCHLERRGDC